MKVGSGKSTSLSLLQGAFGSVLLTSVMGATFFTTQAVAGSDPKPAKGKVSRAVHRVVQEGIDHIDLLTKGAVGGDLLLLQARSGAKVIPHDDPRLQEGARLDYELAHQGEPHAWVETRFFIPLSITARIAGKLGNLPRGIGLTHAADFSATLVTPVPLRADRKPHVPKTLKLLSPDFASEVPTGTQLFVSIGRRDPTHFLQGIPLLPALLFGVGAEESFEHSWRLTLDFFAPGKVGARVARVGASRNGGIAGVFGPFSQLEERPFLNDPFHDSDDGMKLTPRLIAPRQDWVRTQGTVSTVDRERSVLSRSIELDLSKPADLSIYAGLIQVVLRPPASLLKSFVGVEDFPFLLERTLDTRLAKHNDGQHQINVRLSFLRLFHWTRRREDESTEVYDRGEPVASLTEHAYRAERGGILLGSRDVSWETVSRPSPDPFDDPVASLRLTFHHNNPRTRRADIDELSCFARLLDATPLETKGAGKIRSGLRRRFRGDYGNTQLEAEVVFRAEKLKGIAKMSDEVIQQAYAKALVALGRRAHLPRWMDASIGTSALGVVTQYGAERDMGQKKRLRQSYGATVGGDLRVEARDRRRGAHHVTAVRNLAVAPEGFVDMGAQEGVDPIEAAATLAILAGSKNHRLLRLSVHGAEIDLQAQPKK